MDELKFVMKCFLVTCLLFALSQYKTDGITVESQLQNYLVSSSVAQFVNESAHGAVKIIKKTNNDLSTMINNFLHKPEKKQRASTQIKSDDIDLSE